MFRFIETVRVLNGEMYNVPYHNARIKRTFKSFFNEGAAFSLEEIVQIPKEYAKGLVKLRIVYDKDMRDITFSFYERKGVSALKVLYSDDVEYSFKYEARDMLSALYEMRGNADEILIVKNGFLTDSYFANIVFEKDGRFFTPKNPLLEGTMRMKYLEEGVISLCDLSPKEIKNYEKVHLINAFNELGDILIPVKNILY